MTARRIGHWCSGTIAQRWSFGHLVVLLALIFGCSSAAGPKLAPVTGIVKLDGVPVGGAGLEFIADAGGVAYGKTDGSGRYYMSFGSSRTGAIVGKNVVKITASDKVTHGDKKYESKEIFPKRYNVNTELVADVSVGSNRLDFNCESSGEKTQQPASKGGN